MLKVLGQARCRGSRHVPVKSPVTKKCLAHQIKVFILFWLHLLICVAFIQLDSRAVVLLFAEASI